MNDYIIFLHNAKTRFEMLGAWGMAEILQGMIDKEVKQNVPNLL